MLMEMKVHDFVAELASDSPAPGGGSISALAGALGAGLAAMVCRLTVNLEKYAAVKEEIEGILEQADPLAARLSRCVDADTEAFNQVMAAYKLPKGTDEEKETRSAAIQDAMTGAARLPLKVAADCLAVQKLAVRVLTIGNSNAASDAAVSGLMAHAGLHGALYNVKINLGSLKDPQVKDELQAQTERLIAEDQIQHALLVEAAKTAIG